MKKTQPKILKIDQKIKEKLALGGPIHPKILKNVLAQNELNCTVIHRIKPHHTTHVTTKLRCGMKMVLARPHHAGPTQDSLRSKAEILKVHFKSKYHLNNI